MEVVMRPYARTVRWATLLVLAGVVASCGSRHHLGSFDFAGRTLAIVHVAPRTSDLRMGVYNAERDDPISMIAAAGSRVAVELEARRVRARLDSAAARVAMGTRLADRTADRTTMYLGARRVDSPAAADYVLDMRIRSFGVSARSWQSAANVFLEADVVLIDVATGTEIWSTEVSGWDNITPHVVRTGEVPRDIITAAGLLTVSTEDLERTLERVVDVSADAVTDELREKLRDVRRDRITRR
jgi:ABC-type uncharacterized transport system auxiliary subunit